MIGILFASGAALGPLQRQVLSHVFQEITHAAGAMKTAAMAERGASRRVQQFTGDDDFAFALVNMLLALSGSQQGCREISAKASLMANLCTLLQVGTERLQRAVLSVLRRAMLDQMPPAQATRLLTPYMQSVRAGGVVAYLLSLAATPFRLNYRLPASAPQQASLGERRACPSSLPDGYIGPDISRQLLGVLREAPAAWAQVLTSAAVKSVCELAALPALGAGVLDETVLWHAVAGLNLLSPEVAAGLTSEGSARKGEEVYCCNHQDGATLGQFQCKQCPPRPDGSPMVLCSACDQCFHLSVDSRKHIRVPLIAAEEQMTVSVRDGTSRLKTPLLVLAVDGDGTKAVLELKAARSANAGMLPSCRFCDRKLAAEEVASAELSGLANVCGDGLCAEKAGQCCTKQHVGCGHACGGVAGEEICLPCLQGCDATVAHFSDMDDFCQVCWTESLAAAPSIRLGCGHVVHHTCAKELIAHRWNGPVISFSPWSQCPSCKVTIGHPLLEELMAPVRLLKEEVERKALMVRNLTHVLPCANRASHVSLTGDFLTHVLPCAALFSHVSLTGVGPVLPAAARVREEGQGHGDCGGGRGVLREA